MFKILLLFILAIFVYAAEDTYVFEAKGAFAKELKALVEKYSKNEKINVKVYKKDDSIVSSLFNPSKYDKSGKEIYEKKCASCHGINGEVGAGAGSRILKNMSKKDMLSAIYSYRHDEHYGGSMKSLMQDKVIGLNEKKVISIYNYLHKSKQSVKNSKQKEEKNKPTGTYLQ